MPIYDYKCPKCNEITELSKRIEDCYTCPDCLKCQQPMVMLVTKSSGIHFKGSGFYETDYKNKG